MKKILTTLSLLFVFVISNGQVIFDNYKVNCYSQSEGVGLSDKVQLTYKDFLNLRLQILAAQLTSGSYSIIDMGRIDYPVSISFNKKKENVFT